MSIAKNMSIPNYYKLRRAELIDAIQQKNLRPVPTPTKPRPNEMNLFEQEEMAKSRPVVRSKLNKWYDWPINHVPKTIRQNVTEKFRDFKNTVAPLYKRGKTTPQKHTENQADLTPR